MSKLKLYNFDLSPFAARVRMQLYAKDVAFDRIEPPKDGSYTQISATGKVPALKVEDWSIAESETICEFIEETHPKPALLPARPEDRAEVRFIARVADLYVLTPLQILFKQMNPDARKPDLHAFGLAELEKGLGFAEGQVGDEGFAWGSSLTLADCALMPALFLVKAVGPSVGAPGLLEKHSRLSAYYAGILVNPHAARVHAEMAEGLSARLGN